MTFTCMVAATAVSGMPMTTAADSTPGSVAARSITLGEERLSDGSRSLKLFPGKRESGMNRDAVRMRSGT